MFFCFSGALYDSTGSYNLAFHCAGIPIMAGALVLFLIPWAQRTSKTSNIMKVVSVVAVDEPYNDELCEFDILSDRSNLTVVEASGVVIEKTDVVSISTQTDNVDFPGLFELDLPMHSHCFEMNDVLFQLQNNDKVLSNMLNQTSNTNKESNPDRHEIPVTHTKSETLRVSFCKICY